MAFLTRNQVKSVIIESLKVVADLPDNVEEATFTGFDQFQQHTFLSALKSKLNALPYNLNNGQTTHAAYYDVDLKPDSTDDWPTVKDCIDWVTDNQYVVYL